MKIIIYIILLVGFLASVFTNSGFSATSTINAFSSDGCSLFPNGTLSDPTLWCDCCFMHDIAYWQGGSIEDRNKADQGLRSCVLARTGNKLLADTMYYGVRIGGEPAFPTWFRWGYGWNYGREYKPLTTEELRQVSEALNAYKKSHPVGYCPKQ